MDDRIKLRMTQEEKRLIAAAVRKTDQTFNRFVVQAAVAKAREILK